MTTVAPGPYEAKTPRNDPPKGGYRTAEQELSDALEGTAPALARTVRGLIGPARTVELARAVKRAMNLAVRRHTIDQLADALAIVQAGIDGIPPECEAPEPRIWAARVDLHPAVDDRLGLTAAFRAEYEGSGNA